MRACSRVVPIFPKIIAITIQGRNDTHGYSVLSMSWVSQLLQDPFLQIFLAASLSICGPVATAFYRPFREDKNKLNWAVSALSFAQVRKHNSALTNEPLV